MSYFIKNIRNIVILGLLFSSILAVFGYFSLSLNAQAPIDPRALAEEDARKNAKKQAEKLFLPIDIANEIYPDDKRGCAMKSAMFFVLLNDYGAGNSVNEALDNKMLEPLVKEAYAKIEKLGLVEASLQNMKDYQNCIEKAKPHKDPSREYDLSLKHGACLKLNSAILDTLDAIKYRRNIKRVYDKYGDEDIDFSYTSYKNLPNPIPMFVGSLYKSSKAKDFESLVMMSSSISAACYS